MTEVFARSGRHVGGEQHGYLVSLVPLRDQLAAKARPTLFVLLGAALCGSGVAGRGD